MDRPGVMIYFSTKSFMQQLTLEEKGKILDAILDYGATGNEPSFCDRVLVMLWAILKQSIDRDDVRYQEKILQRKYATFCREVKKHGDTPMSFDSWMELQNNPDIENHHPISVDNSDHREHPIINNQSSIIKSNTNINYKAKERRSETDIRYRDDSSDVFPGITTL